MTNRRNFIKQTAALACLLLVGCSNKNTNTMPKQLTNIGIQLFSLPKLLENDFLGAIKMLQGMGYTELELYGPYTFSEPSAKKSWQAITPALGFSGSGYYGRSIQDIKNILADHGMTTPSAHTDLDTLINGMGRLAEAAHILGHQYVTLPAIPDDKRTSLDDYKRIADTFNKIGKNAKKEGIKFAYHNHGYGIKPVADGTIPLELIIDNTDPSLVFLEMDIFWTTAGGANPMTWLKKYPNRYHLLHLKDMKPIKTFAGDGGDASQWIELFPYMATTGDGDLGVSEIVKTGLETGVKHFIVEQDMVAQPEIALKNSIDFLKKK